jgi:glycosyltransferase involved in cell wall biosynthesis
MTPPLVSVLVPAFNAGPWIEQTLESAVHQTWPNVEVIVVDDGSRDDTLLRARKFESARVLVLSQVNQGAAAARNHAYTLAQGEFIQWLDADDLLAPNKIECQVKAALQGGVAGTLYTGAFGEFFVDTARARFKPTVLWQDVLPVDYLLRKFTTSAWFNPACWLVARDMAERAGPWDERLSFDDDGEYFARLVSKSSSVRFVPEARVYYRRANPSSLSRLVSERACESLMLSLQLCVAHLLDLEDSPRTRSACVRYLQSWVDSSDCLCPDSADRFARAQVLAQRLQGELRPQRLTWKYAPVQAVFGWAAARRARAGWAHWKLRAQLMAERRGLRS